MSCRVSGAGQEHVSIDAGSYFSIRSACHCDTDIVYYTKPVNPVTITIILITRGVPVHIELAYGSEGLGIEVPDGNLAGILRMNEMPVVGDPRAELERKLAQPTGSLPLVELATGRKTACIVISDITRPVPNSTILPPVLEALERAGIPRDGITILIGTGLHRPNEGAEQERLLGPDIPGTYRVVNHIGRDRASHEYLGETPVYRAPIYVDKTWLDADLKIATGLIEPHFMAGYSGGRKAIMPGICGAETVKVLHGPDAIANGKSAEGVVDGNPLHEEMLYVAEKAGVDFIVNVTLNEERAITGVFAGGLDEAHREGVRFMEGQCVSTLDSPVDAVITTAAGYPLDLTFYQSVKALTAAMPVLREGGVIILAAKCAEGIGSPDFTRLILDAPTLEQFLMDIRRPGYYVLDQWQLQKMAMVRDKFDVWFYSDGIDPETQRNLFVTPLASVAEGLGRVKERFGDSARIAVIPEGPYVAARLC